MKNLLLIIGTFLLSLGATFAQTNLLDQQLQKVNQSSVTSGIIYNRVTPLADLCVFNMPAEKPHNTADFRFFKQALFELYKASNYKEFLSVEQLEEKIMPYNKEMNVVPIGIINTPFQSLNFNPENPDESGLVFKDGLYAEVSGKAPFLNGYALVVAPLKNAIQGEKIIYKFSEDLIFNHGDAKIESLIADFGDGNKLKIIENGALLASEIVLENNKNNGDKTLHFMVELSNGFTFYTNATIYTVYGNPSATSLTAQPIACSSTILDPYGLIQNFKIDYVQATEAFQGLTESVGVKGQIEPRVFYHTKNGTTDNYQKTLLKPILIVDGFDPNDLRRIDDCDCERDPVCQEAFKDKATGRYNPINHTSFVELMNYKDEVDQETNLIKELRDRGYDVILVNQPTYTVNGVKIDGGADFIERNALAFVALVKEVNAKLQANGSTEKLVVLGPSMGGQITRYALAYMEKKEAAATTQVEKDKWKHNTRIWVAFDSPNHGANVPLGDQALIKILAADSVEAQNSFNKLQSVAANEMLINYFKTSPEVENQINNYHNFYVDLDNNYTNASTTSQGMPVNAGGPIFQAHYNNQFNNGLPDSHGFPMKLRKLAVVNGSLSGETFGEGYEKILDVSLFKTICLFNWTIGGWHPNSCFSTKAFQATSCSIPTSNNLIARTEKLNPISPDDTHIINSFANSNRGNLDNVPGGSIDATNILHSSITGAPIPGSQRFWQYPAASLGSFYLNHIGTTPQWETRVNKPNQCFIPTYSSIGIKNPNQSWSNPLDRNLVCSNETYFDSYFGEANNTGHVKLNYRGVNWLLKELGTNTDAPSPQAPYFPIQAGLLTGPDLICNSNSTYTFLDPCKIPSKATWTVSPNLQIVASTNYSVTVKQITNGQGTITATFQNGQTVTKTIWVGKPSFTFEYTYYDIQPIKSTLCVVSDVPDFTLEQQGVTSVSFTGVRNFNAFCIRTTSPYCKEATVTNACGSLKMKNDCVPFKQSANNASAILDYYTLSPNPSNDVVTIDLVDQNNLPEKGAVITGELFNMMGISQSKVELIENKATFSVKGLNHGIYVLKIYINDQVESHQIAVE